MRRVGRGEHGASTLELVLYTPLLVFVIFVTVQAGLAFLGNQAASAAAREAARVARSGGGTPRAIADARLRGEDYAASVGHGLIDDVRVRVALVPGRQVRATVTARGVRLVPSVPGLDIRQVAQGPIEEFRPDR